MRVATLVALTAVLGCSGPSSAPPAAGGFESAWPPGVTQPWAGADFWTNPLQDWRIAGGRLENVVPGGDRHVFLLTREVGSDRGDLRMEVRLGRLEADREPMEAGFVGFRVGIGGLFDDYRDSAVRGVGVNAGIAADGRLFVGRLEEGAPRVPGPLADVVLRMAAAPSGPAYRVTLDAFDAGGHPLASLVKVAVPDAWLTGGVALVCSSGAVADTPLPRAQVEEMGWNGKRGTARGGTLRFWFRDWRVAGSKVQAHPERAFGPILFAMHTLSRRVLKLTAQMAPVDAGPREVMLEIRPPGSGAWTTAGRANIDPMSRTATFRVAGWDDTHDIAYRVVYRAPGPDGQPAVHTWDGTVRRDPEGARRITVAAFTGNNDLGFPHADVVRHVKAHAPDFLFFSGDNIYERVGEYGIQRAPLETATLDYLRKWYLFGWEYGELLRDLPAVAIPDDHDVYHGNVWGAGGRHAEGTGAAGQDQGGYTMPAPWVNMVQRTQTSALPDPVDPAPVLQDISVYFTDLLYGGVSFAVLEDRKWKSAPKVVLPKAQIVNGWAKNPEYRAPVDGDVSGAELLGPRQEAFLERWAADWSGGAWMKAVLSQTIFANVATLPVGADTDDLTPSLRVMEPNEYPENEAPVADHDSDGWPQAARNRALRAMRRGLAVHLAGDQHLGSTVHYGIDDWNDAGWAICVPSVANIWPRRWYPAARGRNQAPGAPRNTGEYLDGFGNKVTVQAVSNPVVAGVEPAALNNRAPGYGIVIFDREARTITFANWPRWVDPAAAGAAPYPGWPITVAQLDNGFPRNGPALAAVDSRALFGRDDVVDPVIQVVDQQSGEIVYTLRIQGTSFVPRVRRAGVYTVRLVDPDRGLERVLRDQRPVEPGGERESRRHGSRGQIP